VDLGLMQINSIHLAPMHLELADLFDPCGNVRIGTTILADFYRRHRTIDPPLSLFKALSAYNTGRAWKGAGYVNKILAAAGGTYRVVLLPAPEVSATDRRGEPKPKPSPAGKSESAASPPFFFVSTSMAARKRFAVGRWEAGPGKQR
jgi:type IV secretion system protein VirB1